MTRQRWFALALVLTVAAALAMRLAFRIDLAEEIDALRFVAGVQDFDPAADRPHFPGYPVFIFAARALVPLTGGALSALTLLCALCGALLVVPMASLTRRFGGDLAGVLAAVLTAINPLLWLVSDKVLSDVPGLLLAMTGLWLVVGGLGLRPDRWRPLADARRARWISGAGFAVLGLAMGVRASYWPFLLSAAALVLWRRARIWPALVGGAAGVAAWAVPMLVALDPARLATVGMGRVEGHFNRFGGSVLTESEPVDRATGLVRGVLADGFGGWWPGRPGWTLMALLGLGWLLLIAWQRYGAPRRHLLISWTLLAGPYLGWLALGQNVVHRPRHALPLVALLIVAVAAAAARALAPVRAHAAADARDWDEVEEVANADARPVRSPGQILAAVALAALVLGQAFTGWALSAEHVAVSPPPVALARDLQRRCTEDHRGLPVLVYSAALAPHLRAYAPCVQPIPLRRLSPVRRHLARQPANTVAYATSDLTRLERLRKAPEARFRRNPWVHRVRSSLAVYRLR